jgi:large subunit ribosomal protein L10
MKRETPIPEYKLKTVEELNNLIKENKTILIASIKNIPGSQFQEIGKKLRGKAIIKVPKKNLIFRAIDSSKNKTIKKLKEQIKDSIAILFSNLDCYDLALELSKNTSPAKAKPGQEAIEDIQIEAGPTDLVPGPAISELGALGIQIQIEKGKIHIKESKIIAKKGEKISQNASELMGKLDIKPFSVGFIPLCAFDTKENKLYLNIKINKEETIEELKISYEKALAFSVEIEYSTKDTIKFLLSKALAHENKINRIITGEPEPIIETKVEEKPKEEVKKLKKEVPATEGLGVLFG